jgi:hypothetical protein
MATVAASHGADGSPPSHLGVLEFPASTSRFRCHRTLQRGDVVATDAGRLCVIESIRVCEAGGLRAFPSVCGTYFLLRHPANPDDVPADFFWDASTYRQWFGRIDNLPHELLPPPPLRRNSDDDDDGTRTRAGTCALM